ncbi:hypothetical protein ACFWMP_31310 [Paenibacillus sp. NPDC058367]|uniref:hypothetical protein n=1 Tax=Paenibacillus sp. NPDC058367 TaxID=3346460 RepID=UPI0036567BF3
MFRAIADGFNYLFGMLADFFWKLMNGLLWLLQPIFDLVALIFSFIVWIGVIIVKIVLLVFAIGKLLVGLIAGLFTTILGFGYSGSTTNLPGSYMEVYSHIRPYLSMLQLDKIAYLIQFGIWFFTAWAALRLIGGMRGGGGSE